MKIIDEITNHLHSFKKTKMGNSIAQAMAENQKAMMREMQEEQLEKMWNQV